MSFLIPPAYAQAATDASSTGSSLASLYQFAPLVLIAVVFYFLMIRPQQAQAKTQKAMLNALKRGDRVVTSGGIVGTVKKALDGTAEVDVEIAPNVTVSIVRTTISRVITPQAANDAV